MLISTFLSCITILSFKLNSLEAVPGGDRVAATKRPGRSEGVHIQTGRTVPFFSIRSEEKLK